MYQIEFKRCREEGGLAIKVVLTIDAEGVHKSLTSRDLKTPAEKTLLGHVCVGSENFFNFGSLSPFNGVTHATWLQMAIQRGASTEGNFWRR